MSIVPYVDGIGISASASLAVVGGNVTPAALAGGVVVAVVWILFERWKRNRKPGRARFLAQNPGFNESAFRAVVEKCLDDWQRSWREQEPDENGQFKSQSQWLSYNMRIEEKKALGRRDEPNNLWLAMWTLEKMDADASVSRIVGLVDLMAKDDVPSLLPIVLPVVGEGTRWAERWTFERPITSNGDDDWVLVNVRGVELRNTKHGPSRVVAEP